MIESTGGSDEVVVLREMADVLPGLCGKRQRPLGIPAPEDRLVQKEVVKIRLFIFYLESDRKLL